MVSLPSETSTPCRATPPCHIWSSSRNLTICGHRRSQTGSGRIICFTPLRTTCERRIGFPRVPHLSPSVRQPYLPPARPGAHLVRPPLRGPSSVVYMYAFVTMCSVYQGQALFSPATLLLVDEHEAFIKSAATCRMLRCNVSNGTTELGHAGRPSRSRVEGSQVSQQPLAGKRHFFFMIHGSQNL